jgi:two-component system, chemotaxis family, protein-glutamate methylesterase/glutaminase
MSQDNIRVLVVDDSAVSRAMICNQIEAAPDMSLAGMARNGSDAIDKAGSLRPDVITLDLRMPDMDGLEVLDVILRHDPIPVIMVSSLTYAGAAVTLDALEAMSVAERDAVLLPADSALASLARLDVDAPTALALVQGRIGNAPAEATGKFRCYGPLGRFLGLVEAAGGTLRSVRLARSDGADAH